MLLEKLFGLKVKRNQRSLMSEILKEEFQRFCTTFFYNGKIILGGMLITTIYFLIYGVLKVDSPIIQLIVSALITTGAVLGTSFLFDKILRLNFPIKATMKPMRNDSIDLVFNFPEEIKTQSEQYLLYFAQFLQDLGINATSNLKDEAEKILFSVTPTDDIEALDKIREALAVYLNLPSSPIVYDDSFAASRLQQQIENLQHSQKIAAMELQFKEKLLITQSEVLNAKNITISQQLSIIDKQNEVIEKILSPSIMMNSIENEEEFIELYQGIEVGKTEVFIEHFGIHLNLSSVLRKLGEKFLEKANETKSTLNLEEKRS
jgi:hypothetical protein